MAVNAVQLSPGPPLRLKEMGHYCRVGVGLRVPHQASTGPSEWKKWEHLVGIPHLVFINIIPVAPQKWGCGFINTKQCKISDVTLVLLCYYSTMEREVPCYCGITLEFQDPLSAVFTPKC